MRGPGLTSLTAALWLVSPSSLLAGQGGGTSAAPPPPPLPPATISRGAAGAATVRAVRISEPLELDGRLDEGVYKTVPPIGDFIQQEPREGELATEQTEVWILFDATNLYISARCWDSAPEREVANEMRRDASGIVQNESFGVTFDTFGDKRNGVCCSCRARWAASVIRRSPTNPATTSTGTRSGTRERPGSKTAGSRSS